MYEPVVRGMRYGLTKVSCDKFFPRTWHYELRKGSKQKHILLTSDSIKYGQLQ